MTNRNEVVSFLMILAGNARPLHIAIAHQIVQCKPGRDADRLVILNRLFGGLSSGEQIRCRIEIQQCRDAKRGKLAEVTGYHAHTSP